MRQLSFDYMFRRIQDYWISECTADSITEEELESKLDALQECDEDMLLAEYEMIFGYE